MNEESDISMPVHCYIVWDASKEECVNYYNTLSYLIINNLIGD